MRILLAEPWRLRSTLRLAGASAQPSIRAFRIALRLYSLEAGTTARQVKFHQRTASGSAMASSSSLSSTTITPAMFIVDDSDTRIQYTGNGWLPGGNHDREFAGSTHISRTKGDTASLSFNGECPDPFLLV